MNNSVVKDELRSLLEPDLLRHIVTLKVISSNSKSASTRLIQNADQWGLLTMLPTTDSNWDMANYPKSNVVALIDGNNADHKLTLLNEIQMASAVINTYDEMIMSCLKSSGATKATSFTSFTDSGNTIVSEKAEIVEKSSELGREACDLLSHNGYSYHELSLHFSKGATWFGIRMHGKLVSVCFVYQNYQKVWEIAGVYTTNEYRKHGLAKLTVTAAIGFLRDSKKITRYQVQEGNVASMGLARSAGLVEYQRLCHYWHDATD